MNITELVAVSLLVFASACGGSSSPAPKAAAPSASSDGAAATSAPTTTATTSESAPVTAPSAGAAPVCIAMGKPCTANPNCCYGSCRIYDGSKEPVCAP